MPRTHPVITPPFTSEELAGSKWYGKLGESSSRRPQHAWIVTHLPTHCREQPSHVTMALGHARLPRTPCGVSGVRSVTHPPARAGGSHFATPTTNRRQARRPLSTGTQAFPQRENGNHCRSRGTPRSPRVKARPHTAQTSPRPVKPQSSSNVTHPYPEAGNGRHHWAIDTSTSR
jgi:hypothetical protein